MPWDGNTELTPEERLISSTMGEWYEAKHRKQSDDEISLINSIVPESCPRCCGMRFVRYGRYRNGCIKYKCLECGSAFNPLTNTIFDSHRIPISEWVEFLIHLFEFHSIRTSSRDNRNASPTGKYWLTKVFEVIKGFQDGIVLSGEIVFDETYFSVVHSERTVRNGKLLRGISRDKICIAVATDGTNTVIVPETTSKPSRKSTLEAMECHIKHGSTLIHDDEHSHSALVSSLGLKEIRIPSSSLKLMDDSENPLTPVNDIHSLIKKFMRNHEGFSREDIADWMNLISFIINEPQNRFDKVEKFMKMALSTQKRLKYRDVMSKK